MLAMQKLYRNSCWWTAADRMRKWNECLFHHSLTVAELSSQLGQALGVSDQDVQILWLGGFLHDIGKTTWPRVLVDKTPLDEDDWQIVRVHPLVGAAIARELDCCHDETVIRTIREHHEHGENAYPKGIRDLHPLSKMIIVAELFTAMTEPRPYRLQPLSCNDALHLLSQNGHSQVILKALEQLVRRKDNSFSHKLISVPLDSKSIGLNRRQQR